jgi:hypothetical protein
LTKHIAYATLLPEPKLRNMDSSNHIDLLSQNFEKEINQQLKALDVSLQNCIDDETRPEEEIGTITSIKSGLKKALEIFRLEKSKLVKSH